MKNIGIFTHDLYPHKPWGQGRYVFELAKNLRRIHPGRIFVFSPAPGMKEPWHVQLFAGSHDTLGKNITFSVKLGFIIKRLIRKYGLGLLHFQGGPGGLFLIHKPSVPIVYTVHHTYYQQSMRIGSQRWKKVLFLWELFGYRNADFLIYDSVSTSKVLAQHYGVRDKSLVIPLGVDGERFYDLNLPRIPDSLFFIGRLEKRKGIDFLVKAMPMIKAVRGSVRLFIAGDGVLRAELENMVARDGLEDSVTFLGVIDDGEVNGWYNRLSVAVTPSVFEGFGLSAIESMACGTPVVATDVDGLRDVVEDGVNGLLVPYGDANALSESILHLLGDGQERRRLARNGKQRAESLYSWENVAKCVADVYRHIMSA